MRIIFDMYQRTKNSFAMVQPKNACRLEFACHLWLQFPDQPQYYIVVFSGNTFHIYKILITRV